MLVGPDSGLMLKLPKSLTPKGDWLARLQVPQRAAQGQVSWICTNHSLTYFSSKGSFPPLPAALWGCPPARQETHSASFLRARWPLLSPSSLSRTRQDMHSHTYLKALAALGYAWCKPVSIQADTECEALASACTECLMLVLTRGQSLLSFECRHIREWRRRGRKSHGMKTRREQLFCKASLQRRYGNCLLLVWGRWAAQRRPSGKGARFPSSPLKPAFGV